jgi:hypothetical protein
LTLISANRCNLPTAILDLTLRAAGGYNNRMTLRPRFRLSILLWLTLAAACWFGGREFERRRREEVGRLIMAEEEAELLAIEPAP